jgi:hypothetical protein
VLRALACLIVVSLCGCYPPVGPPDQEPPAKPQQAQALDVVLGVFGAPSALGGPAVRWREGAALDCGNGAGWVDGPCIAGLFDVHAPEEVQVAWRAGDTFSRTGLAHELAHWYRYARGLDPDQSHRGPDFAPGGSVERANHALSNAGL